jgi:Kef-type K+ transport system membrane component KefB
VDSATLASLTLIALVAVIAPVLADLTKNRIPGVIIEIVLGVVIGTQVLGWAHLTPVVVTLGNIGLTFLFFMAGYELEVPAIRGRPLRQATIGWFVGLALSVSIAGFLVFTGFALSTLLIAFALTTTALGTLLPMLHDNGEASTRFGAYVIAIGGVGEFLPVVAIALLLTTDNPFGEALLLALFVVLAAAALAFALRPTPARVTGLMRRHLESSAQLPIRVAVLLIILLVWVATHLGLDVLLGAFAAGLLVRVANRGEDSEIIGRKLSGIAFGFFVPLFFIVSGMRFDLSALTSDPSTFFRLPLFLGLFFVVRGLPVLLLYRRDVPRSGLLPMALLASTALPLVVAITEIGLQTGKMRPANAAALVGAGMLSVLLFPATAFALRRRGRTAPDDTMSPSVD